MARITARRSKMVVELEHQRDMLRRQREQDQRVLSALYNISLACRDRPTLRAILETISGELSGVFSFDAIYIALCDEQPETFSAALLVDEGEAAYIEGMEYGFLTGAIVRDRAPLLYRDLVAERDPSMPRVMFGNTEKLSRAWLGVPLMVGPDAVGVISIQSYQVGVYTAATQDLLQRMANVIAVAVQNVRLIELQGQLSRALSAQVDARTGEISALSSIASAVVARQPLPAILGRALDVAMTLFGFDAGNVRLIDDTRAHLVLQAYRGFDPQYAEVTARSPLETSPLRDVVIEGRPQVIERGWRTRYHPERFPIRVFPPFDSALSLPLSIGSSVLGTLSLFGLKPRPFSEHELSLAQAVANQIAIVVENTRLFEERERQISELRTLGGVSRAASTAQDLRQLLRQVHDALKGFIPLDAFSMLIYDPEREVVSDAVSIDEGHAYDYWGNQPPPPRSLSAWIIRSGMPLRFENLPEQIAAHEGVERHIVGADRQFVSWLGVPMFDREGRVIGVISVQGYTAGLFDPRDEALMHNVAAQVALHVQNVRLLTQRARQIGELEAIGQIGKLVTASYDLDLMLDEVRRVVASLTDASVFYLLICEPASRAVTHAVFVEEGAHIPLDVLGTTVGEGTMSDWILRNREPLLYDDLRDQREDTDRRGIAPRAVGPDNEVRSWAGVPLLARDGELIGVLSVQDYRPYRYDSGTIDFLEQVGSHVSLGVQKMRLFESTQSQAAENARLAQEAQAHAAAAERQATRMELVQRIASVLSARLDQQEILEIASRELVQLFWADHTGTVLFVGEQMGVVVAEYPPTGAVGQPVPLSDNLLIDELHATRRPLVIWNIESDPRAAVSRERFRAMGITSLVVVPLISRDRVFGSISLDSYNEPLIFSDEELDLMVTVSTAVAAAVENAQLFAAEQEQRRTADTLREMARVLSSSFNPDEVLRLILGELHKVIAYDTASIMLLDGDILRMVASRGRPDGDDHRGITLPVHGSAAGEVVRRREPLLWVAGSSDGSWAQIPTSANIRAWIGAPLIARGNMIGVLNIDIRSAGGVSFSDRDIEVARTFANHAAVALENAQLYQESITRIEQELEIARRIQSNLFPRQLPSVAGLALAARCIPARETGGDFYDMVDMGSRLGVIVGDVSGKSLPAAMLMAVARSTSRSEARNHETPWVVLTETNRWLVDDVPKNAFVALSYAVVDPLQRRLTMSNGGQLSPLLRRADGATSFITAPEALPLGMIPDAMFGQVEIDLAPGDTVLFYTDGIVEAHDTCRDLFGFDRLEALISRWGHLSPDDLIALILVEVNRFAAGAPTHDDMTLVVVRVS
ncbi:GAF domain-containing protein [Oscillochloris sp. ZM17-4]|uniref:GAF domain-containing protein n=1 Tax=Oscillochloris sp. ZM17-4 TaxID=2866714 RepID=UPI001C738764|nr:GAF domain-containing protein [Oscillochloris sp. ZM17-4]MBX0326647.1 GAF domain-containing protein [Oscillochloris sp. ZM17-4]